MDAIDRLNEIKQYVVTTYPNCCLASNYGNVLFEDFEKDLLVEELNNYFWNEHMNLCSCGTPQECQEAIRNYLHILHECKSDFISNEIKMKEIFNTSSVYDNPLLLLFVAYAVDSYGFTEHGSGIGGAWITPLGEMYLVVLKELLK